VQELNASATAAQFVEGLAYPIAKADVLARAREAELAAAIVDQLAAVPDRTYESAEDLTGALNAAS